MMIRFSLLFSFAALLGCATAKPIPPSAIDLTKPETLIVSGCTIQDTTGKLLWSYPEWLCIYFPDGRFVAGGEHGVTMHTPDQKPIWHLDLFAHHMMALAANGDILVLSSDWNSIGSASPPFETSLLHFKKNNSKTVEGIPGEMMKQKFRTDKIVRISPEGKIVATRTLFNDPNYPLARLKADYATVTSKYVLSPFEASHANSIYEIGPNSSPLPAFKPGNILINDLWNGMITILDPDLKQILWQVSMEVLGYSCIHDVQILPNGHLLFFRNMTLRNRDSSLEEVDPVTLYTTWKYVDPEPQRFQVPERGSVQALSGGRHLFAYPVQGKSWAKMLDANNKIVWELNMSQHFDMNIQGAYALPVESFLQHSQSL